MSVRFQTLCRHFTLAQSAIVRVNLHVLLPANIAMSNFIAIVFKFGSLGLL